MASAIAGEERSIQRREKLRAARRLWDSLTLKLVALVVIFLSLPVILYGQFERADREKRELVSRSILQESMLIAQALAPSLDTPARPPLGRLNDELTKFVADGTTLKLMLRPASGHGGQAFYYVASAPRPNIEQVDEEWSELLLRGIPQRLSESCTGDLPLVIRYRPSRKGEELLTSEVPIKARWGCWVLITTHTTAEFLNTEIGRPYWQTREMRLALLTYVGLALLALATVLAARRNLRLFGRTAREMRQGASKAISFAARNTMPELDSVAFDIDQLVFKLHSIAKDIRQTAEDNAHSFKAPLATIQASLAPLERALPEDQTRPRRALALIESSMARLKALVNAAQQLDRTTADLIDAPRRSVDLTHVVAEALRRYREMLASRKIFLTRRLDSDAWVRASAGSLETVVENVLDNAISFSPPDGSINVLLTVRHQSVMLQIDDQGPGIDPELIDRIFERYVSLRPEAMEDDPFAEPDRPARHSGLGLWIVRRNVESLGGSVSATNKIDGGLSVRIILPAAA